MLATAIEAFDLATLATEEGSQTYRRLLALQDAQAKLAIKLATADAPDAACPPQYRAAATAARDGQSASKLWERNEA